MSVDAAAAPRPALKFQLLPELRDMQVGNQIQSYYKCFMEQHGLYRAKESIDKREKWLAAPLAELKDEKEIFAYGGSSTRQADNLGERSWITTEKA